MSNIENRYVLARAKSRAYAEWLLEDMFANGEVSEGEKPKIELEQNGGRGRYVITAVEI